MNRRTRKQKIQAQKRIKADVRVNEAKVEKINDRKYFQADLTKSLWLTMLAIGVEVALWYLLK